MKPEMGMIVIACLFAWLSGALFTAAMRGASSRNLSTRSDETSYPAWGAEDAGAVNWLRSPNILIQLGLLAAFIVGALLLILFSL